jgi:hypothetical protein
MNRPAVRLTSALPLALAVVAACSAAPAPTQPVGETDNSWQDIALAPGTWVYRQDERGSVALYGEAEEEALFLVRCVQSSRQIFFSRAGRIDGRGARMEFQATHGLNSYRAENSTGDTPYIVAGTNAQDSYLDTIAFSRGRIAISVNGQGRVAIPSWPQMTRVFEDCRA